MQTGKLQEDLPTRPLLPNSDRLRSVADGTLLGEGWVTNTNHGWGKGQDQEAGAPILGFVPDCTVSKDFLRGLLKYPIDRTGEMASSVK